MAIIRSWQGMSPRIGKNVYLADNVILIGDVVIEDPGQPLGGCTHRQNVQLLQQNRTANACRRSGDQPGYFLDVYQ